jgi:hypothetical protein
MGEWDSIRFSISLARLCIRNGVLKEVSVENFVKVCSTTTVLNPVALLRLM